MKKGLIVKLQSKTLLHRQIDSLSEKNLWTWKWKKGRIVKLQSKTLLKRQIDSLIEKNSEHENEKRTHC